MENKYPQPVDTDPRGPFRKITKVEESPEGRATAVTMDCGHVSSRNQIYVYKVGTADRCYHCRVKPFTRADHEK